MSIVAEFDKRSNSNNAKSNQELTNEAMNDNFAELQDTIHLEEISDSQSLDPLQLVPGQLGEAIAARAEITKTPAAVLIHAILPCVGSLLPIGTQVEINAAIGFKQKPILWNVNVSETGSCKSETNESAIRPLYYFQEGALAVGSERTYCTTTFTMPGLSRVQQAQPNHGSLIYLDELAGFARKIQAELKTGKSDDLTRLLTLYDGTYQHGTYADSSRNFTIGSSAFNLLSGIQPSVLLENMGDLDDSSGLWARFNFVNMGSNRRSLPIEAVEDDPFAKSFDDLLLQAYGNVEQQPRKVYRLSPEAYQQFRQFYDTCEDARLSVDNEPAIRAYAAKSEGRCARIALILHCLRAAAEERLPDDAIGFDTVQAAITISNYYTNQLRAFYGSSTAARESSIKGTAYAVYQYLKRKAEPCTTRQIKLSSRKLKKVPTSEIRQSCVFLTAAGHIADVGDDSWQLATVRF